MKTLFVAATAVVVFVFAALAVLLWNTMTFPRTDYFDFRFLMLILLAIAAKFVHDRIKVVLKEHT
ncbi:hypothetical protein HYV85_03230 [Candidatus Woesearchaeota archaeon]|nr:hypothetical protein [Candidatus Woesearchaeota archaeon]